MCRSKIIYAFLTIYHLFFIAHNSGMKLFIIAILITACLSQCQSKTKVKKISDSDTFKVDIPLTKKGEPFVDFLSKEKVREKRHGPFGRFASFRAARCAHAVFLNQKQMKPENNRDNGRQDRHVNTVKTSERRAGDIVTTTQEPP